MTLGILKARLEALGIVCLERLPKNATHSFKLRLIVIEHKDARFIDGELDLSHTTLPDTVENARRACLAMRRLDDRHIITLYTE